MSKRRHTALSIALTGDEPPSEFRIFTSGTVDTVKGDFVFDDAAATAVMAEYQAHGIDLMIDYCHASIGAEVAPDPSQAGKAAGWFQLEVRNGELWAVNVRWTEAASAALSRKEWRFMSPAFEAKKGGQIASLLNVALTNIPATRRLEPLMAASVTALGAPGMSVEEFLKVCKALGVDMSSSLDEAMAKIKGEPPAETPAEETPSEAPTEALAEAPAVDEEKEAVAASISNMFRMTGSTSMVNLSERVTKLVALEADHEKSVAALAKERAAIELGKRKENALTLTKLGAETPHTTGLSKGKLCKRLLDEPLDEQNDRVAAMLASKGGKLPAELKPPSGGGTVAEDGSKDFTLDDGGVRTLSARELAMCTEMSVDPKIYAAKKPPKKD